MFFLWSKRVLLGFGEDCHAHNLGLERSFKPASPAHHVTSVSTSLEVEVRYN